MTPRFAIAFLAASCLALPAGARAAALDAPLACNESAHQFVADLIGQNLIDPNPTRVEDNSINAFRPARDASLQAFGYRVFAVVGFQQDDPLFRNGNGTPIAKSAYGAVVLGGTDNVQKAVTAAGSNAIVHHVAPFVTAIFCKRE